MIAITAAVIVFIAVIAPVIVAAAIGIAVVVMIPAVIVFDVAAIPIPVTLEEFISLVTRTHPARPFIGRPRPITGVPYVTATHRIPIPVDPNELGSGSLRDHANHTRWRRLPNPDADGKLCGTVNFMALHETYHVGQAAYVRSWLGKPGVMG